MERLRKLNELQVRSLTLLVETVLIILTLATGGKAAVGMICYWALVSLYHLTDLITGKGKSNAAADD